MAHDSVSRPNEFPQDAKPLCQQWLHDSLKNTFISHATCLRCVFIGILFPELIFGSAGISDNYTNGRHRLPSCAPLTRLVFRSSQQFSLSPILCSGFQRKRNPVKAYRDVVWTTIKVSHCWYPQTLFPSEVFISPFLPSSSTFPKVPYWNQRGGTVML